MSADSGYGISNASGFATISLVVVTLLLLGVLTLMTVDVMQSELQIGYSEQAFRQAEIDAESRMALAMAQLARQGQTVPESQTLADGVLWWKGYPASDGSPLVTLVAQGRSPTGDARARIRQQFSWLALYPELPPTAVLAPELAPAPLAPPDASISEPVEAEPQAPIIPSAAMQHYLDGLFVAQGEQGARIQWLEDQASEIRQGCEDVTPESSGLILIVGSCVPARSVGSAAAPVILLIRDGSFYLQDSSVLFGVVILYSSTTSGDSSGDADAALGSVHLADGSRIEGALISQQPLAGDPRQLNIRYEPRILQRMQEGASFFRLVRVTGSWRDW
ncbi:hypothetical protein [Pseudaeromonas pectinilytica]